ncbi:YIP1 family protein [Sporosarcina jiandibaonis]|uniref:YIP1 family protein n=1 Tax=Sporosarcina jiandibaonis TaxID=2715535 RepID=UPI00155450CA|nr:YIP1 family protein [Sporosarcina jiandibaonis]
MNPLLSIWSQPKNTVQYMMDNKPISYLVFLAILYSFATGILMFADLGFFEGFSLPAILLIITVISIILNIAGWGLASVIYTWLGKLLGGTGTIRNMCYAVAAGSIPMIWTMPIGFIAVIIYGEKLFMQPVDVFAITNMSTGFYLINNLIAMGVSIYGIVVLSKAIGLVHNFSATRGFGVVMITLGTIIVVTIMVMFSIFLFIF